MLNKYSIPYRIINTKLRNYENKLLQILKNINILICLAGYMKIISKFYKKIWKKNHKYSSFFATKI